MSTSLWRLAASLALVVVPTVAACGSGENLSVGTDALHSDSGGGGEAGPGEGGAADGGTACKTAADCGPDAECGFPQGAACAAVGACFSTKGIATCAAYSPGCACDGTTINVACAPLPTGYTTKPILHAGNCTAAETDAGAGCASDAECGSTGVCGFPRVDACTAKGTCFPKSGANCNAILPGCACDGTGVNLACNYLPSTYAPKPLRHSGACVDGG